MTLFPWIRRSTAHEREMMLMKSRLEILEEKVKYDDDVLTALVDYLNLDFEIVSEPDPSYPPPQPRMRRVLKAIQKRSKTPKHKKL